MSARDPTVSVANEGLVAAAGAAPAAEGAPAPGRPGLLRRGARAVRIALALGLIVLSLWSVLLPVSVPISATAAVTARLASVAAPIQGDVDALAADTGDRVGLGDLLAELGNRGGLADDAIAALEAERANLRARLAALETEIRETEALRARYARSYDALRGKVVDEAEALAVEAVRYHHAAAAALGLAQAELVLLLERRARGGATETEVERARRAIAHAERDAAVAEARASRHQAHVEHAQEGVFVSGDLQAPRYLGLLEDADLRLTRLRAERELVAALVDNRAEELTGALRRRRALAERRVGSPVSGVVWTRPVNVGQFVESGSELYRIADESTLHVQAYFHRRYLDGMSIGDEARVYLVGSRQVVAGKVKVIQALDAAVSKESYAIDLPIPDADYFRALIELEPEARSAAEIGGVAKVAVVGRLEGRLGRALMWLYLRFES